MIDRGCNEGGRNHAAQKLSINLIATEQRLTDLGIPFTNDAETLYYDFCDRCNPALLGLEADLWFQNGLKRSWNPSCDDNVLCDIYQHWLNRQLKNSVKAGQNAEVTESTENTENTENTKSAGLLWLKKRWLNYRKFTPTITVHQDDFEFPADIDYRNKIIAINSGLGTSKTRSTQEYVAKITQQLKIDSGRLIPCIWVAHRLKLLAQSRADAHTNHGLNFKHVNDENGELNVNLNEDHITACPESLHKLRGHFEGKLVVIDELCGVLSQLVSGGTVTGQEQTTAMAAYREMMNEALCVINLDANSRDIDVELLEKLAPNKEAIKIKNTKLPRPQNIIFTRSVTTDLETGEVKKVHKRDM